MSSQWMPKKPNFGPPPAGYIAGLGRGATGFITRSDLGPARLPASAPQNSSQPQQAEDAGVSDAKYDEWEGYKGALFSKNGVDEQDRQAEEAYDYCERRVFERRKPKTAEELQASKQGKKPQSIPISQTFVDLKRDLAKISIEEWENIPESVDSSIKKRKRQKYTPVPDSMIVRLLTDGPAKLQVEGEGGNNQDFREAKQVLLKSGLDRAEHAVQGQSRIDKIGYMTQLDTSKIGEEFIGDVKRARQLLRSAVIATPNNPDIWISAARVEEIDGKLNDAREIMQKAVQKLPLNEDLWIELARLEKPEISKNVLLEGLRHIPMSQKLWIYAARRQDQDKVMKSKILKKGLEQNPQSVRLWRELIQLEDVAQAKQLLYKAVECLPKQVDLWLALAKMEDYQTAQKILNKARKNNELSLTIWIHAAKLQQTQCADTDRNKIADKVEDILLKSKQILKKKGNNVPREEWLEEAFFAQKSENLITCQKIVKMAVSLGLTQEQLQNAIIKDTQFYEKERQSNYTTRFLYKYGVLTTKSKKVLQKMIEFQERRKHHKEHNEIMAALKLGLTLFEQDSQFWLKTIDKLIDLPDFSSALGLIDQACSKMSKNVDLEAIKLKKIKILTLKQEIEAARVQLQILRETYPNGRSIVESIIFQQRNGEFQRAWKLCEQYFKDIKSEQIWLLAFRIRRKVGSYGQACQIIEKATTQFSQSLLLWSEYVQFELASNHLPKARAILDKAMLKLPNCEQLALINVETELKYGSKKQANHALNRAIKAFPKSGQLWAIAIELQQASTRKKKAASAVQQCGTNVYINLSIAKLFWKEGKHDKAKKWIEECLNLQPNNAEVWCYYLHLLSTEFKLQYESSFKKFEIIQENELSGRKWKKIRRNHSNRIAAMDQLTSIIAEEFKK